MIFLVLDFETKDPFIGLGLGAGWVFAVNYPENSIFFPIGFSYCVYDSDAGTITPSTYLMLTTTSLQDARNNPNTYVLLELLDKYQNIVMHNAQYDLGCLRSLDIDISRIRTYDTKIIAKLYDSSLYNYSLDPLLSKYFGERKFKNRLIDVIKEHDLLKTSKGNVANSEAKSFESKAQKWAYSNMDVLQQKDPQAMADYANQDTYGTAKLFKFLYERVGENLSAYYSNIQKICVKIREKGIDVDMDAVDKAIEIMTPLLAELEMELYKKLGNINLQSNAQLPEALERLGYKLPKTDAGNPSASKEFFEEHPTDELCLLISKYRTIYLLLNTFVIKVKEMQKYTCPYVLAGQRIGKVFPELNLLEARTGRFSSANPNIQNIPKRDKEYAALCRAIFVPSTKDKEWFSLDWSNQEGRLQLHYAYLNGFSKTDFWLNKFKENPKLDTHSLVAEMMGDVPRVLAKTIYLGKSFCMGQASMAKRLGLPTEWVDTKYGYKETAGPEALNLIEKYEEAFPYLTELQQDCKKVIIANGFIKTIGGRKCQRPPKFGRRDFDYKAISLLIQGSAADQMYQALTLADEAGINIKCVVHDEFNIEGTIDDAKKMKEIMETCTPMVVPSVAEVKRGKSWGELSKCNL